MYCYLCHKSIVNKITWRTLFTPRKKLICDRCFFRYPISITNQSIPLNKNNASWISLFPTKYHFDPIAFSFEMGRLFQTIIKGFDGIIIYFDELDYQFVEEYLDMFDFDERIVIVTFFS